MPTQVNNIKDLSLCPSRNGPVRPDGASREEASAIKQGFPAQLISSPLWQAHRRRSARIALRRAPKARRCRAATDGCKILSRLAHHGVGGPSTFSPLCSLARGVHAAPFFPSERSGPLQNTSDRRQTRRDCGKRLGRLGPAGRSYPASRPTVSVHVDQQGDHKALGFEQYCKDHPRRP